MVVVKQSKNWLSPKNIKNSSQFQKLKKSTKYKKLVEIQINSKFLKDLAL